VKSQPSDDSARVASLVERAKQGDDRAFESLVGAYKDRIHSYVSRMVRDPEEALDIAQDTFLRAYQSLPRFRGASSFQTWLYRIATNLSIDAIRRTKRRQDSTVSLDAPLDTNEGQVMRELPDEGRGPELTAAGRSVQEEVAAALQLLSPALRPVLVMYDLQGMSYQEIAQVLGCPLGTVKSRLFNARLQLKQLLEDRL
jgi:RNA polymerase sigma-70 factor (ECF subfamily)